MSAIACPRPFGPGDLVQLAHGGGGRAMHGLLQQLLPSLPGMAPAAERHDAAVVAAGGKRLAFTSDSYVVRPRIFPGGDLGSLAVHGTVNDLAMAGAMPLCLSCSLIIEEGLPLVELEQTLTSLGRAARAAGVAVVTGDTKVVERGKGDGVFINTAGIGLIEPGVAIGPQGIAPGDAIILSGDLGRHAIAVMTAREGFDCDVESDSAPLHGAVAALLDAGVPVHCLRDPTRGGLASTLVELAEARGLAFEIREAAITVPDGVRGVCEILGLDPLYLANEGRFVAFVPEVDADRAVAVLRTRPEGTGAAVVGRVLADPTPLVTLASRVGSRRIVPMLSGEHLPRIC